MQHTTKASKPFPIAIAQMPIQGDAHKNGNRVRALMRTAATGGARLIQFPEGTLTRAHAAIHNYWVGLSVPSECTHLMMSGLIGPDGAPLKHMTTNEGLVIDHMDRNAPELDVALHKARPWRSSISTNEMYKTRHLNDPRSANRTCL